MNQELRKYLSNISQLYGFACSIPFGQFWLDFIFMKKVSLDSFMMTLVALSFGVTIFFLGGIINAYDRK